MDSKNLHLIISGDFKGIVMNENKIIPENLVVR